MIIDELEVNPATVHAGRLHALDGVLRTHARGPADLPATLKPLAKITSLLAPRSVAIAGASSKSKQGLPSLASTWRRAGKGKDRAHHPGQSRGAAGPIGIHHYHCRGNHHLQQSCMNLSRELERGTAKRSGKRPRKNSHRGTAKGHRSPFRMSRTRRPRTPRPGYQYCHPSNGRACLPSAIPRCAD